MSLAEAQPLIEGSKSEGESVDFIPHWSKIEDFEKTTRLKLKFQQN